MSSDAVEFPAEPQDLEPVLAPIPDPTDLTEFSFAADDDAEPDENDPPAPVVELRAALVADPGLPAFPGRKAFRMGRSDPAVTLLGQYLVKRGGKRFYAEGPGPVFGVADRNACAAFQRAQGWSDKNADGYPGPVTWKLLVSGEGKDIPKASAAAKGVRSPVPGFSVTYAYGVKNRSYAAGWHTGADYAAPTGSPIVAVVSGTVIRTDWGGAYGNWTQIRGDDGHVWMYAHQSRRAIKHGKRVQAGTVIGYVGSTGHVTGPHLHLEKSKGAAWAYGRVERPTW